MDRMGPGRSRRCIPRILSIRRRLRWRRTPVRRYGRGRELVPGGDWGKSGLHPAERRQDDTIRRSWLIESAMDRLECGMRVEENVDSAHAGAPDFHESRNYLVDLAVLGLGTGVDLRDASVPACVAETEWRKYVVSVGRTGDDLPGTRGATP